MPCVPDRSESVIVAPAWGPTLNVALHLHPDTERVVVLNGASVADREWAAHARADLASYASRVDITYLTGLPVDRMQTVLAQLPERTIVLVGPMLREGTDTRRTRGASIRTLLHQSIRPVYGLSESRLGEGIIGGYLWSARDYGVKIAEVALGILQGQRPFRQEVEVAAAFRLTAQRALLREVDDRPRPAEPANITDRPIDGSRALMAKWPSALPVAPRGVEGPSSFHAEVRGAVATSASGGGRVCPLICSTTDAE